jgi:putative phosphoesterase
VGILVGLISDTHGLVRPEVFPALEGVELILHAGDVGEDVLVELNAIAPVHAVRGNTDPEGFPGLEDALELELGGVKVHVSHGHEVGSPTPDKLLAAYPADVIVYGHTHKQLVVNVDGRWVINPGAAGAQRFKLKPSVARMTIADGKVGVELVELA